MNGAWGRLAPRGKAAGFRAVLALLGLLGLLAGCGQSQDRVVPVKYLVGVSQANLSEPWRIAMCDEIRAAAARDGEMRVLFTDAADSPRKQVADVNSLLEYGVDLIILSPADAAALTPAVKAAYDRVPVIILDRAVEGYDYTLYIGPDNQSIGRRAGGYVAKLLGEKGGAVLLINGLKGSPPAVGREAGFREAIARTPAVRVIDTLQADWLRDRAEEELGKRIGRYGPIDVIVAQNDDMAFGASLALAKAKRGGIPIIGVDGLPGPRGGLDLVANKVLDATFTCPTGGSEAIAFASDILRKREGIPKKVILRTQTVTRHDLQTGALKGPVPVKRANGRSGQRIVLGFAQVGAESVWRLANTRSVKEAAAHAGIELHFADGQQDQDIQKAAVRRFIAERVDVIAFSPRLESGWEDVLNEAKTAGIPVILTDRSVAVKDDSLWVTFMGSDFLEEGRRAARWLLDHTPGDGPVGIVELQGTQGSAPAIDRGLGFREVLALNGRFRIIDSRVCDFTFQGGKDLMARLIADHGHDIKVVFSHNDDMALGAIEAIEAAGLKPGTDISIVSIDAGRNAFEAMIAGKLACTVECTPLLGPMLMKAVQDYMDGKELPARIISSEGVFPAETAAVDIKRRQY
jgi:simple sugar transport system substrate-binding protein